MSRRMIFGEFPVGYLRQPTRDATDDGTPAPALDEVPSTRLGCACCCAAVAAAPAAAGGIEIGTQALYVGAGIIAGFLAGTNPKLSELSSKLDTVILKLDQILFEIQRLRYEIREIVREESSKLMQSDVNSLLIMFAHILESSNQGTSLSDGQKADVDKIRFDVLRATLRLWSYRRQDGYAHWMALSTGALIYIASSKIAAQEKSEVDENYSVVNDWLLEAIDYNIPYSLASIAVSHDHQADALRDSLSKQVGIYRGSSAPSSTPGASHWFLHINGSVEEGFWGELEKKEYPYHLTSQEESLPQSINPFNPRESMVMILGSLAKERDEYLTLREGAAGLRGQVEAVTGMIEHFASIMAAY